MTGLVWCHGCQTNVRPKFTMPGRECPRCGTSLKRNRPKIPAIPDIDLDDVPDVTVERSPRTFDEDLIRTPRSGRLVLNPKVDSPERNPLCPDCEEPIKRVEHDHGPFDEEPLVTVEFVCGCDSLRRFDFAEVAEPCAEDGGTR